MFYLNFADDWIRTTDFWYQKPLLYQWAATTTTKKYQNFETEYDRFNSKILLTIEQTVEMDISFFKAKLEVCMNSTTRDTRFWEIQTLKTEKPLDHYYDP